MCQKEHQERPLRWREGCLCPGRTGGQGQDNKVPRASKAAADLEGISAPPEIIDVVGAVESRERRTCSVTARGGALAHHRGGAEAEGGRDVEVEKAVVAETKVVVVAGIDAKLSVGAAEVPS